MNALDWLLCEQQQHLFYTMSSAEEFLKNFKGTAPAGDDDIVRFKDAIRKDLESVPHVVADRVQFSKEINQLIQPGADKASLDKALNEIELIIDEYRESVAKAQSVGADPAVAMVQQGTPFWSEEQMGFVLATGKPIEDHPGEGWLSLEVYVLGSDISLSDNPAEYIEQADITELYPATDKESVKKVLDQLREDVNDAVVEATQENYQDDLLSYFGVDVNYGERYGWAAATNTAPPAFIDNNPLTSKLTDVAGENLFAALDDTAFQSVVNDLDEDEYIVGSSWQDAVAGIELDLYEELTANVDNYIPDDLTAVVAEFVDGYTVPPIEASIPISGTVLVGVTINGETLAEHADELSPATMDHELTDHRGNVTTVREVIDKYFELPPGKHATPETFESVGAGYLSVGDRVEWSGSYGRAVGFPATVKAITLLAEPGDPDKGEEVDKVPWSMILQGERNVVIDVENEYGKTHWAYDFQIKPLPSDVDEAILSVFEALRAVESAGEGGVTRLTYYDGDDAVGTARIMGSTLGDIEVEEDFRKQGYGTKILRDLEDRGASVANVVSSEGRELFKKAGWQEDEDHPGRFHKG